MSLNNLREAIDESENAYTACLADIWYFLEYTQKEKKRPIGTTIGEIWALLVGVKPGIAASELNAHFLKGRLNEVENFGIEIAVSPNVNQTNHGNFLLLSRKLVEARMDAERQLASFCRLTSSEDLDKLLIDYKGDPKATHDNSYLQIGFVLGFPASALYAMARQVEICQRYPGKELVMPSQSKVESETKGVFSRSMPDGERYELLDKRITIDSIIRTHERTRFFEQQGFTHEESRFFASERGITISTPLEVSPVLQFKTYDYPDAKWGSAAKDISELKRKLLKAGQEKRCLI